MAFEFWQSPSLQMTQTASSSIAGVSPWLFLQSWDRKYDSFSSRSIKSSKVSAGTSGSRSALLFLLINCNQTVSSSSMSYSIESSNSSRDFSMNRKYDAGLGSASGTSIGFSTLLKDASGSFGFSGERDFVWTLAIVLLLFPFAFFPVLLDLFPRPWSPFFPSLVLLLDSVSDEDTDEIALSVSRLMSFMSEDVIPLNFEFLSSRKMFKGSLMLIRWVLPSISTSIILWASA